MEVDLTCFLIFQEEPMTGYFVVHLVFAEIILHLQEWLTQMVLGMLKYQLDLYLQNQSGPNNKLNNKALNKY